MIDSHQKSLMPRLKNINHFLIALLLEDGKLNHSSLSTTKRQTTWFALVLPPSFSLEKITSH